MCRIVLLIFFFLILLRLDRVFNIQFKLSTFFLILYNWLHNIKKHKNMRDCRKCITFFRRKVFWFGYQSFPSCADSNLYATCMPQLFIRLFLFSENNRRVSQSAINLCKFVLIELLLFYSIFDSPGIFNIPNINNFLLFTMWFRMFIWFFYLALDFDIGWNTI